jgi:hypothetical protein
VKRFSLFAVVVLLVSTSLLGAYVAAYFLLCVETITDEYYGHKDRFRRYRTDAEEYVFRPAGKIEGICRGEHVWVHGGPDRGPEGPFH